MDLRKYIKSFDLERPRVRADNWLSLSRRETKQGRLSRVTDFNQPANWTLHIIAFTPFRHVHVCLNGNICGHPLLKRWLTEQRFVGNRTNGDRLIGSAKENRFSWKPDLVTGRQTPNAVPIHRNL